MYCYYFRMVDLLIRVNCPFEISDFHELNPYHIGYKLDEKPDAVYQIDYLPQDWEVRGQALFRNRRLAVYRHQDQIHRYFYWNVCHKDRYLVLVRPVCGGEQTLYIQEKDLPVLLPDFRLSAFFSLEHLLLEHQSLQLHASVIDWQGSGILFSAPSGTGKSTQAALWRDFAGAKIINGDRAMIRRMGDGYRVYGSPYAGSSGIYTNLSVPIRAIITLEQGSKNRITSLHPMEAFRRLYRELTVSLWDEAFVEQASCELLDLIGGIPVYHLICTPDKGAVEILMEELNNEGIS